MSSIKLILPWLFIGITDIVQAQAPDSVVEKNRIQPLLITSGVIYGASLVALNELWYDDFERESFHFFNDNSEWKQIDKAGHFYTAFQLSLAANSALRWAGVEEQQAFLYSSVSSLIMLSSIEIFDGYSAAYGASYGDVIANTSGALFFYGQKRLWNNIRLHPKFSFNPTSYPQQRPAVLGENLAEEILKDYNAQTYWLSIDLSRFFKKFPKWLNLAVGYGAHDMVFAEDDSNINAGYTPRRQYYLALDFDLNEYKSNSQFINFLIHMVNMVHLPAPALEYSGKKFKFHYSY